MELDSNIHDFEKKVNKKLFFKKAKKQSFFTCYSRYYALKTCLYQSKHEEWERYLVFGALHLKSPTCLCVGREKEEDRSILTSLLELSSLTNLLPEQHSRSR